MLSKVMGNSLKLFMSDRKLVLESCFWEILIGVDLDSA